ncbi:MAG: hypothetical protein C0467_08685 [Planctomycetaceae bacterium]|nr:hypothetical protein [Planctomycetaceae bacterium]
MINTTHPSEQPTPALPKLEHELAWLAERSAGDIAKTRCRLFGLTPPAAVLPEGKTVSDMVEGRWPGDETDQQVRDALDRLS